MLDLPFNLREPAHKRLANLPFGSIDNFDEVSTTLIKDFLASWHAKKSVTHLLSIKQHPWESLCSYLARFNKDALYVEDKDDYIPIMAVMNCVQPGDFLRSLARPVILT